MLILHAERNWTQNNTQKTSQIGKQIGEKLFFCFFCYFLTTQTRVLLNNPTHLTSENCHTCTSIRITTTYVTRAQKLQTKSYNTTSKQFQLAEIIFSFFFCRPTTRHVGQPLVGGRTKNEHEPGERRDSELPFSSESSTTSSRRQTAPNRRIVHDGQHQTSITTDAHDAMGSKDKIDAQLIIPRLDWICSRRLCAVMTVCPRFASDLHALIQNSCFMIFSSQCNV